MIFSHDDSLTPFRCWMLAIIFAGELAALMILADMTWHLWR